MSFGVPTRNGLGVGLLASTSLATRNRGGFSPLTLFAAGEQGYWLDPSDFSTMFQDAAGTTPVTAVGQSVRLILDKSQGLVPGPQLVTNGTFDTDTDWSKSAGVTIAGGVASFSAVASGSGLTQTISGAVAGRSYRIRATISGYVSGSLLCRLSSGSFISLGTANGTVDVVVIAGGNLLQIFAGINGSTFNIDNISVREIPGNHFTQANVANAPILQVDGTGRHFLLFDGTDDWLQSAATINPGAVDKAQVFAGVRKLSDAAIGIVVEASANAGANNGSFYMAAPEATGVNSDYSFNARGSLGLVASVTSGIVLSPNTSVITGLSDISAPFRTFRRNGIQTATSAAGLGSSNFLTYTHFIGRRGGVNLPFNGRLYQIIMRYGPNLSAGLIAQTEIFVNQRTGAY